MNIVDGYCGVPHIKEWEVGEANAGTTGSGNFVLEVGKQLSCQIITNNKIRINDGTILMQGRRGVQAPNSFVDLIIENGAQGTNRNDLIVCRYTKDEISSVESMELKVVKGISGATAVDPSLVTGNIRNGDLAHEMPLYRVSIVGLNVTSVTKLFTIIPSIKTVKEELNSANTRVGALTSLATSVKTSIVAAVNSLVTAVNGKAPTSHASSGTGYGVGTTGVYGHVKTVNAVTQASHTDGTALSAYQGKLLNDRITAVNNNISKFLNKRNAFVGTREYRFVWGKANGGSGYARTNEVQTPFTSGEFTAALNEIHVEGLGAIPLDYKGVSISPTGGIYLVCNTNGANGMSTLINNSCLAKITITLR